MIGAADARKEPREAPTGHAVSREDATRSVR
jgi:hypothetical protein